MSFEQFSERTAIIPHQHQLNDSFYNRGVRLLCGTKETLKYD
jgi:hypothetical protein